MFLADEGIGGLITLIVIIAVAAVIAVVAFLIHRFLHPKLKSENEKPADEQILKEELNRVLEPVEDEETAKEISEYKDEQYWITSKLTN